MHATCVLVVVVVFDDWLYMFPFCHLFGGYNTTVAVVVVVVVDDIFSRFGVVVVVVVLCPFFCLRHVSF